ncbi:ABC transporter ATP-binding protein [Scytonema sp. PCC 10023]|uniref:ABC transporter ATP-binding protein n=1 Tax=Scytonema sp. PCC 10023 TaxID=1680591 RepID=UPI0039C6B6CF
MRSTLLHFQDVSKIFIASKFRKVQSLANITFSSSKGEFVVIIGPSGCGKSTILRLAAGLDKPTSGEVLYYGKPIQEPERQRGLVFQSYSVFPWLSVRENIAFGLNKSNPRLNQEKVSQWLAFTGLTEFADAYPKTLSGGMRQRVALARTMIVEPELLLLDEPFGALDEPTRDSMQALLLKAVANSDCSVLLVTHDIREALILADRIILMSPRPGRILDIFVPPPDQPRTRDHLSTPEFKSLYDEILERFPVQVIGE